MPKGMLEAMPEAMLKVNGAAHWPTPDIGHRLGANRIAFAKPLIPTAISSLPLPSHSFMKGDIGTIKAVQIAHRIALHGRDRAPGGQHRNAVLRHILAKKIGQRDHRLVPGAANRPRAPA